MTMKRLIRRAPGARTMAAVVVMLMLCAAFVVPASARGDFHLRLLRSDPAADATLAAPPRALRLTFSEAPELAVTSVRLRGPGNRAVALSPLARQRGDRATVVATPRAPLANGHYTVTWRTMSNDGHPMRGTFHFTVGR